MLPMSLNSIANRICIVCTASHIWNVEQKEKKKRNRIKTIKITKEKKQTGHVDKQSHDGDRMKNNLQNRNSILK